MPLTPQDFESRIADCRWALSQPDPELAYLRGARMLDIGSGFGAMAVACERAGVAEYLGVDPWPFGASVARLDGLEYGARLCYEQAMPLERRDAFSFFEGTLDKLVPLGERFDVAILFDVLEHIPDAAPLAQQAFAMLRPGGLLIAVTGPLYLSASGHHLWGTSLGGPWAHLKPGYAPTLGAVSPYRLQNHHELGRCTHEDIRRWFTEAGFAVVREHLQLDSEADWLAHRADVLPEILAAHPERLFREAGSEMLLRKPG